jgi:hypothetical protein
MTITRTADGCWELRTRYGTLIATGDLYTLINTWARMRRAGWSDVPLRPARADRRPAHDRVHRTARLPVPRVQRDPRANGARITPVGK